MKRFFLKIQTTSDWPQIWCGGWNWDPIEAYQISAKSETKIFLRFGLVCFGHKSEDERPPLFISMGNLQFQIWVSDQSKSGFVYFYWLFTELLCVISDILIECIGFLENFTKLLEKSYRTTYFINKIEKTFRRWLQHFCRQLNRSPHKKASDFLAVETPPLPVSLSWFFPPMTMIMMWDVRGVMIVMVVMVVSR